MEAWRLPCHLGVTLCTYYVSISCRVPGMICMRERGAERENNQPCMRTWPHWISCTRTACIFIPAALHKHSSFDSSELEDLESSMHYIVTKVRTCLISSASSSAVSFSVISICVRTCHRQSWLPQYSDVRAAPSSRKRLRPNNKPITRQMYRPIRLVP